MEKTIEIQKKNRTIAMVLAIIFLFTICGIAIWILIDFAFPNLQGFWNLKIAAILVIATVMVMAVYLIIRQEISTKPSLIIDQHGITDNSNVASVGLIPWSDIIAIKEAKDVFRRKILVVIVKNPDEYINKTGRMREGLQVQYKQFGSPIVIPASNLEYDTEELITTLNRRL